MRLVLVVVALFCAAPIRADGPFLALDFEAAAAKAKAENKLLLVEFTSMPSANCDQMDQQTWPDPAVTAWIAHHAVAIRMDFNANPDLLWRFLFDDAPTVILLRDDVELDRHTGFRNAQDFVAWGDGVLAGRTETAALAASATTLFDSEDFDARYAAAFAAQRVGDQPTALRHFLWLWPRSRTARPVFAERAALLVAMTRLADSFDPAREAFNDMLDDEQQSFESPGVPDRDAWTEWVTTCLFFRQPRRVVAWYEARRDDTGRLVLPPAKSVPRIELTIFGVLLAEGRAFDAMRAVGDVRRLSQDGVADYEEIESTLSELAEYGKTHPGSNSSVSVTMRKEQGDELRSRLSLLYAGALAAGEVEQAEDVAGDLLKRLDDADSRIALVKQTLQTRARPSQLAEWLDEAAAMGGDVTALRDRLAARPGAVR